MPDLVDRVSERDRKKIDPTSALGVALLASEVERLKVGQRQLWTFISLRVGELDHRAQTEATRNDREARLRSAEEAFAELVEASADPFRNGDPLASEFRNRQIQRLTREIRLIRQEMKSDLAEDRPASQP